MYPSGQNTRSSLLEWSVATLGAAAAVYLASQVHLNLLDKERLQAGHEEVRRNVASLSGSVKQGEEAFQKREIYLQKLEAQEARHAAFLKGFWSSPRLIRTPGLWFSATRWGTMSSCRRLRLPGRLLPARLRSGCRSRRPPSPSPPAQDADPRLGANYREVRFVWALSSGSGLPPVRAQYPGVLRAGAGRVPPDPRHA